MLEVVVPLDGSPRSETVLPHALALAGGGPVTLVTTKWDHDVHRAQDYLRRTADGLGLDGVETTVVLDREPADAILVTAHRHPGSVICMATHGRGGVREELLGSVAEQVVREAEPPVMLVGPDIGSEPGAGPTMVVAVDSPATAHSIILPASAIASPLGLRVKAAHVASRAPLPFAPTEGVPPLQADLDTIEASSKELTEIGVVGDTELLRGEDPAREIVDLATSLPARYVVVGTHARRGLARVALGSVAMRIVHRCPCPVLVIRA
jgi:nucleotide-binding universal stress UspA family protein